MKIMGYEIAKSKAPATSIVENRGWWPLIQESFAGAWQRNVVVDKEAVLSFHAVFSCMTLIAGDISKLRVKLVAQDSDGIWTETTNPAYSPVLRKPNRYQNRIQFFENWVLSKLTRGNAYILKERDGRNVVTALYVLSPDRVTPMVTPDGSVYYRLGIDNMVGLQEEILVPASEIIHDRYNCLFHPLVGLSPIYASGLAATQGQAIQTNATHLFGNASQPGGLLVAPGRIDDANAKRLKEYWDNEFTGKNAGKIAVLGDGLSFESLTVKPVDAQLVEQLKWTTEVVCSTFHVPPYKIGLGEMPKYDNIQSLNIEYYSQCLQVLLEAIEACLDEGLATGDKLGTEFDLDGLLRMDSAAQMEMLDKSRNVMTPNEARRRLDLKPVPGGDTVYRQQQDHSLEALSKRDAKDDPFAKDANPPAADTAANDNAAEMQAAKALLALSRGLTIVRR
jgi:HK97 family phage portal protein